MVGGTAVTTVSRIQLKRRFDRSAATSQEPYVLISIQERVKLASAVSSRCAAMKPSMVLCAMVDTVSM